jgi:hypothetical protein
MTFADRGRSGAAWQDILWKVEHHEKREAVECISTALADHVTEYAGIQPQNGWS